MLSYTSLPQPLDTWRASCTPRRLRSALPAYHHSSPTCFYTPARLLRTADMGDTSARANTINIWTWLSFGSHLLPQATQSFFGAWGLRRSPLPPCRARHRRHGLLATLPPRMPWASPTMAARISTQRLSALLPAALGHLHYRLSAILSGRGAAMHERTHTHAFALHTTPHRTRTRDASLRWHAKTAVGSKTRGVCAPSWAPTAGTARACLPAVRTRPAALVNQPP